MPDVDPNNLEKKKERIEKAEKLWDYLLDHLLELFEGRVVLETITTTDEDGNETVRKVYAQISAADRKAVMTLMMQNGVRLDFADLPTSLKEQMRRHAGAFDEELEIDAA